MVRRKLELVETFARDRWYSAYLAPHLSLTPQGGPKIRVSRTAVCCVVWCNLWGKRYGDTLFNIHMKKHNYQVNWNPITHATILSQPWVSFKGDPVSRREDPMVRPSQNKSAVYQILLHVCHQIINNKGSFAPRGSTSGGVFGGVVGLWDLLRVF